METVKPIDESGALTLPVVSAPKLEDAIRKVLKEAREASGLTQGELAARVPGFTRNVIANIEIGRRNVRLREFVRIAVALHGRDGPRRLLDRILRSIHL